MSRPDLSSEAEDLLQHSLGHEAVPWYFHRAAGGTKIRAAARELVDAGLVEVLADGWARITDAGRQWLLDRSEERS